LSEPSRSCRRRCCAPRASCGSRDGIGIACSTTRAGGMISRGSSCRRTPRARSSSSAVASRASGPRSSESCGAVKSTTKGERIMCERRPEDLEKKPEEPAQDSAYTAEEEAEVQKRLEELGYVE